MRECGCYSLGTQQVGGAVERVDRTLVTTPLGLSPSHSLLGSQHASTWPDLSVQRYHIRS